MAETTNTFLEDSTSILDEWIWEVDEFGLSCGLALYDLCGCETAATHYDDKQWLRCIDGAYYSYIR